MSNITSSSLASFVFPVLASYKALEHDDITLLRPWLIYWVVVAVQLTVEAYAGLILRLIPLYEFWRLLFTLWLVLPQFQGASYLYFTHVRPFLLTHEQQIDEVIASGYHTVKSMGVDYVSRVGKWLRGVIGTLLFGPEVDGAAGARTGSIDIDATAAATASADGNANTIAPTPPSSSSYVDMIFSKFRIPESAYNYGSSVVPSTVTSLLAMASSAGRAAFTFSIPESLVSKNDKLGYLDRQRAQLQELITSLDEQRKKIEETTSPSSEAGSSTDSKPVYAANLPDDFDLVASDEAKNEDTKSELSSSPPSPSNRKWFGWRSAS